jgi:hypothetical protein
MAAWQLGDRTGQKIFAAQQSGNHASQKIDSGAAFEETMPA